MMTTPTMISQPVIRRRGTTVASGVTGATAVSAVMFPPVVPSCPGQPYVPRWRGSVTLATIR